MKNLQPFPNTHHQQCLFRTANAARIHKKVSPPRVSSSFATYLLEEGICLKYVQALLGPIRLRTTELYPHVNNNSFANSKSPFDCSVEKQKSDNEQITKIKKYKRNKRNTADINKLPSAFGQPTLLPYFI